MARSAENSVWGALARSAAGGRINATLTAVTPSRKTRTMIAAVSRFMTVSPQRTIRTHPDNAAAGSTGLGDRKRVRPGRVRGKGLMGHWGPHRGEAACRLQNGWGLPNRTWEEESRTAWPLRQWMLQDVDQDFLECRNRFGFEVFAFERGQGVEEQLADVGKRRGSARGNGVASQSLENLAEGAIDVGGRVKLLDGQEEFHGAAVSALLVEILTLVIHAKRYVFTGTRRRATASVGGDVGTTGIEVAGIGHGGVPFCVLEAASLKSGG